MNGGGYGEVSGEVFFQYLTIWRADKQGDSGLFGEVLTLVSMKIFCGRYTALGDGLNRCRR